MSSHFDVIVVGLGAMGSAAAFHLSRAGKSVLGLDRSAPPHGLGSSHGETRIIREAYFEDPGYVPLVQRAYHLWTELEKASKQRLFIQTGGLMLGRPESTVVSGARRSANQHRLPHELLSAAEVKRRFPALSPEDGMVGVWEPRAGILFPERCIQAHLALAREQGATLRLNETVVEWAQENGNLRVLTTTDRFTARNLVLAAGPWMPSLLSDLNLPLQVERQVMFWFTPVRHSETFAAARCPIHLWEWEDNRYFYGFPDLGTGVKVARHHEGVLTGPDSVDRLVKSEEITAMRTIVARFLPDAAGEVEASVVCLYTNTPDGHFLIDRHPEHPRVLMASPCSGHGFKFSSAIGEILKRMVCDEPAGFDLSLFRFGSNSTGRANLNSLNR